MLKKTVVYTDFNDQTQTEDLYFNVMESEILDNLDLEVDLERVTKLVSGEKRELVPDEIRIIVDLVKRFMKLAYGVRSEDGRKFRKSEEIWQDFVSGAAYDAFLMSLFKDAEKAWEFLAGVMPKEIRESAQAEVAKQGLSFESGQVATPPAVQDAVGVKELSDDELLALSPLEMTQEQMVRAMRIKNERQIASNQ